MFRIKENEMGAEIDINEIQVVYTEIIVTK